MKNLKEYKFDSIYDLVSLIDGHVKGGSEFWNYDEELFVECATKFSKFTLLHLYTITTALNYYHRDFRKNGDCIDEEGIQYWYDLFETYKVKYDRFDFEKEEDIYCWYEKSENTFSNLFEKMADEVFHILFSNRNFLLQFNELLYNTTIDASIPMERLTKKGTIKRINIPIWVKKAVFHRDKGRCVYCNTDLTNIYNTLINSNYDHMVPLDLMGVNDPCNIQLTCERCNKRKSNKEGSTGNRYIPWWT